VLGTPGLVPSSYYPGLHSATRSAPQDPDAVFKLGDNVVMGSTRRVKGTIR
jgi:hypothetical protein